MPNWLKYTPAGWLMDQLGGKGPDAKKLQEEARKAERPIQDIGYGANLSSQVDRGNFLIGGGRIRDTEDMLRRIATGKDSYSAEALRQGLQQNLSAQRSMAAAARPSNAAAAARTAAIQSGKLGAALSGQQALAGIQERQAATQALGGLQLGARGQDLQSQLGNQGQALGAYGQILGSRTGTANMAMGQPQDWERMAGLGMGLAGMYAMSDRRLKKDIEDGDADSEEFLSALKSYKFKYKDEKYGEGEQLGVMAQDLARSKHGRQAVVETPRGLAVDGSKLATALAASSANLHRRLAKLEAAR